MVNNINKVEYSLNCILGVINFRMCRDNLERVVRTQYLPFRCPQKTGEGRQAKENYNGVWQML